VLPEPKVPDFGISNPGTLKAKDIETYAMHTREEWGLGVGPIADVTLLLENNGAIISKLRFAADGLDAYSHWSKRDGTPYVILGADKSSAVRSRIDAAHELGHLVLHRKRGVLPHKTLEEQAFRFASAFLLPEESFSKELWAPSLDAFRSLKDRWLVSIGAMIKRCQELEIINDDQYQRMWINYTRRGWRGIEPLDESLQMERARLLRRSFEMLVNERMRSKAQILLDLPYSSTDLEEIAGLPRGYFLDQESDARPPARADVVQFPSRKTEPVE
jgi:Zn-dependent peptidase ImmA (M78 family)